MSAPELDLAGFATALARALHAAAVPAGPERAARFARALQLSPPADRHTLYWTARVVFVSGRDEIDAFDRVFEFVFGRAATVTDPAEQRGETPSERRRTDPQARPGPGSDPAAEAHGTAPALVFSEGVAGERGGASLAAASAEERLRQKTFDALDEAELTEVRRLMARLSLAPPERRTRRSRRGRRGERIDLRSTIRRSLRTGGDPAVHAWRRRRMRRRRLVLLLDISGSMEPYARAFLQFLESGVGGASAEAFAFATRLTHLTRPLRGRGPQAAIDRAAAAAPDWSGGTRIGAALKVFNDRWGRRGVARGAIVVILSDGWDRGDPAAVGREMERLRRLAHRIIWVNPRVGATGFEPLARGMAAALPFVDVLLAGDRLAALDAVVEAIGASDRREERCASGV